jgi:hypothetical protein
MIRRIMFCSLVYLCPFSMVAQGQINHQVIFSSNIETTEEILDDGETYVRVKITGTVQMDSVGFPSLPVKYVKLIVPASAVDLTIRINSTKPQKSKLKYKVEPLQEPIPIGFYDKPDFVKPDKKKYNSNTPYPSQLAEIVETGFFRGNHLVTIAVFPCQYYPKKDELEYYETVDFTLNYKENSSKIKSSLKSSGNVKQKKILESIIENPTDIEKFSSLGESSELNSIPFQTITSTLKSVGERGITVDCDYVVVTNQSLAPEFNEFMAWKRRKGIRVELVTMEDISANYTGDNISGINDKAGKLRQFLSEAYNNGHGIEYALLGGDNNIVPIRYAHYYNNTTDDYYIIPTDLYFADFHGDWEVDNDGRYGEPSDNVDYNPEIYVGRVMVSNADEIKNWTKKVLIYEQNPGNGDYSYLTRAFFTQADQLQRDDAARYVLNRANWLIDNVIFEEQGGGCTSYVPNFPTGKSVIDEFNNNYGFCSFMGHGGACNVALATIYYNSDMKCDGTKYTGSTANTKRKLTSFDDGSGGCCWIAETGNGFDNMTNTNLPSINYSLSCETMPFDDFGTPVDDRNMGETYTCISKGGGPHYIGNTRYGYVYSSRMLFAEFVNLISNATSYNLGVVEATSKQNYNNRYLRFSHNLIGCPETEIWTATPSKFTSASVSESGSNVTVSTGGVSNSTICVMSALDNGSSYYQVRENVSSFTFTNVPKPYLVTITRHNYIPYLKNPDNIYIQNESIYSDKYIYGKYFYAGENVTTSKPQGQAIIKNGSNVVFDATNDVNLEGGFEVELGGEFEVK